jgi:hypothetical protein
LLFENPFFQVRGSELVIPDCYTENFEEFFTESKISYHEELRSVPNINIEKVKLIPNERLKVHIFEVMSWSDSENCIRFLRERKSKLLGLCGLIILLSQKPDLFSKDKITVSFGTIFESPSYSEKGMLPCLEFKKNLPYINLTPYDYGWSDRYNFISFEPSN